MRVGGRVGTKKEWRSDGGSGEGRVTEEGVGSEGGERVAAARCGHVHKQGKVAGDAIINTWLLLPQPVNVLSESGFHGFSPQHVSKLYLPVTYNNRTGW